MTTVYLTRNGSQAYLLIVPVLVTKITEKSVYIPDKNGDPRRTVKFGKFEQYHETKAEAKHYLLSRFKNMIEGYQGHLDAYEAQVAILKSKY